MKTLKRSLALILVVVMALGVFAVSASAAELVDMDKVNYTEAVAVINGMGIITGDENGVFDPQGEISRAGAAKLIAYITLGKTLADSLSTNVAPFPDVPAGEWYAGYVNYCAGQGFINGDENGNFNPDDSISGYGYAKLLLCALGYGENEEFIGEGYPMNVAKQALKLDIFKGNISGMNDDPATREEAALYTYNALKALTVNYNKLLETYVETSNTLAKDNGYGVLTAAEGVITKNTAVDSAYVSAKKEAQTQLDNTTTYVAETTTADLGSYVKVITDGANKVYAVITLSETVDVAAAITDAKGFKAAFGTAVAATDAYTFTNNFATVSTGLTGFTAGSAAAKAVYAVYDGKVYSEVVGLVETLEQVDVIKTTGETTTIKTAAGQLATAVDVKNVEGADAVAKGDFVLVTKIGATNYSVVKAEIVEGKLTAKGVAPKNEVTVDGVKYAVSSAANHATITGATAFDSIDAAYMKDNTTKLFLDSKGNYIAIASVDTSVASDIVYVAATYEAVETDAYGTTTAKAYAQVVKMDGTVENVLLGKGTVTAVNGKQTVPTAGLYTYAAYTGSETILKGGNVFTAASTTASDTKAYAATVAACEFKTNTTSITTGAGKTYIDANTQFIFVEGDKATIKVTAKGLTAATMPANGYAIVAKDAQKNVVAQFIIVPGKYTENQAVAADLIYFASASATGATADGDVYKFYVNGEAKEAVVKAGSCTIADNKFYSYTEKDGVFTLSDEKTAVSSANAAGVYSASAFSGLYGTKLSATLMNDIEAGDAVIVDLRTAAQKTASGIDTITSLNDMLTASATKTVTFDAVVTGTSAKTVETIYVKGPTA